MESRGHVQGYSFWTFTDIFSENYFPSVPFQGGFGLLNLHGIAKPAYRAFELLHHLGTEILAVEGAHETVDVWVIRKGHAANVLMTNLAMPRHPIQTELVNVQLRGAPEPLAVFIERIDDDHANPRKLWNAMGEPETLSAIEVSGLEAASALVKESHPGTYNQGSICLTIALPPQSVASITIEFA